METTVGRAFVLEEFCLGYWHVKAVCGASSMEEAKKFFELKYDCDWEWFRVHEVPYEDL